MGINHVGIGSDFYGATGDDLVQELENVSRYPDLIAWIASRGWSDEDLMSATLADPSTKRHRMKITRITLILLVCVPLIVGARDTDEELNAYPAAEDGFDRMVFRVPPVDDETERMIEIIVGKTLSADCNRISYSGSLETRVAEGWGYSYFVLEKAGGPISTRMACPPDTMKVNRFVAVVGDGFLQRYNSRLPIVVHVPDGFEVRYRIWAAQNDIGRAARE